MRVLICPFCQAQVPLPRHGPVRRSRCDSYECKRAYYNEAARKSYRKYHPKLEHPPCEICEKPVPHWRAKACSSECNRERTRRNAAVRIPRSKGPCPHCAAPMYGSQKLSCASPECRKAANRDRNRELQRRLRAEWKEQGSNYRNRWKRKEYKLTPEKRAQYRDRINSDGSLRRALKLGVGSERFRHEEIYERDGWSCGICGDPVDSELRWPDPMSPSLDHIVPLSKGGPHSRANCQLAHLDCNVRKGARLDGAA